MWTSGDAAAPPQPEDSKDLSNPKGSQARSDFPDLETALLFRVAENAPIAIAVVEGPQHCFVYANTLYRKLNPVPGTDILGRPIAEVFPDLKDDAVALIDQIYTTRQPVRLRGRVSAAIPHRPNSVWNIDLVPLAAVNGEVHAVLLMLQDVTPLVEARAQADERAREAEESRRILKGLLQCIPEGIAIADANDVTIRHVSAFGCKMTGRRREELAGIPAKEHAVRWGILRLDGNRPQWNELPLTRAVLKGEVITDEEWILERPDGDRLAILCNAVPIQDRAGAITGGVVAWRDISALKRAEDEHRADKQSLQVALHAAGMATWDFDLTHDTPLGSLRLEHIFGYSEPVRDWGPREILDHVVAEDQAEAAAHFEAAARGETLAFQCRIRRADTGAVRWIAMTGQSCSGKRGKPGRLAGVIQDITATKQAEEAAEQASQTIKEDIQFRYEGLTPRQQAVMALVVAGHANKEVAYRLGIAERTVEGHRARVMERMRARDFASLIRMATVLGVGVEEKTRR